MNILVKRCPEDILRWTDAAIALEPLTNSLLDPTGQIKGRGVLHDHRAGSIGLLGRYMSAQAYSAHRSLILLDLVPGASSFTTRLGNGGSNNSEKEMQLGSQVKLPTGGMMTNPWVWSTARINAHEFLNLDLIQQLGKITLTKLWPPKRDLNSPTDIITCKEIDIHRSTRTKCRRI